MSHDVAEITATLRVIEDYLDLFNPNIFSPDQKETKAAVVRAWRDGAIAVGQTDEQIRSKAQQATLRLTEESRQAANQYMRVRTTPSNQPK